MIKLNLQAESPEMQALKTYLEENVSDALAEKINNGVRIEKDGKTLINKKTLETFMGYSHDEAKKLVAQGARYACIRSDVVFGWAMHYFEEDSIEGTLFNEDGTPYKSTPKPMPKAPAKTTAPTTATVVTKPNKPESKQFTLFDLMGGNTEQQQEIKQKQPQEEEPKNNKTPIIGGSLNQENSQENGSQTPQISDQTSTNIESMLNGNSLQEYLTKMRNEQWAREDAIRKETQEREDTAIQRQVKDMWRAGVNPNLMNVTGAESGGGITNATGIDYSVYQGEVEKIIAEFTNAYNNAFKDTENAEDRLVDLAQSVIQLFGLFSLAKGKATK